MRRLHLDLVRSAWWRQPRSPAGRQMLGVLAVVLLCAAGVVGWRWLSLERELGALARIAAEARDELRQRAVPPPAPLLLSREQVAAINGVVGQLNTPWSRLLDGFEHSLTADVVLLQIEPDAGKGLVKAVAEARTYQQMLDYLARLRKVEAFRGAMVGKQEVNEKDPHRPLRFTFEVPLADVAPDGAQVAEGHGQGGQ